MKDLVTLPLTALTWYPLPGQGLFFELKLVMNTNK